MRSYFWSHGNKKIKNFSGYHNLRPRIDLEQSVLSHLKVKNVKFSLKHLFRFWEQFVRLQNITLADRTKFSEITFYISWWAVLIIISLCCNIIHRDLEFHEINFFEKFYETLRESFMKCFIFMKKFKINNINFWSSKQLV